MTDRTGGVFRPGAFRAEQVAPDPVRPALSRGQALGYAAAAEQIDAAAAYTTMLPRPDAAVLHR